MHSRGNSVSSIGKAGSGAACTKNIPHLHAPQFCMYTSGAGNSVSSIGKAGSGPPCTKNIPHLHATQILHVHIWRWEFGFEYREGWFWTTLYEKHTTSTCTSILHVRKTLFSYTRQFCMYTPGLHTWTTRVQLPTRRGLTRQRARPWRASKRGLLHNKKNLYLKKKTF